MADNFSNLDENFFEEERIHIFGKMYLANVRNRLRELEFPNDIDCKRWIWELVQNAKDSISNQPERNGVDIKVKVENDIYSFTHNGSPFTKKTLFALLYKYTEGKTNNGESTGRFGTGFLTTHSLSKIVKINGDIIYKNQSAVGGFKLIMYREGEDEELLDGLKKTEKSLTKTESTGWTTFEYEAKTTRNKEAGKLGIQNFKENISKVMLFCPEIKSIELNDNGKILSITRNDIIDNLSDGCKKLTLNQKDGDQNSIRTFLYIEIKEHNDKLSEKFNIDRNIRICCAIELDKDNNIIINPKSPCLFCSLPLVGSEVFELPFIINSPDFEPDSERQTILLDGNDINEETKKISDPGINKMILFKAQNMYKTLINYICSTDIKNRYLLARGLAIVPYITRFFDSKWYKENFMIPMREILLEFPLVWNGKQYIKLTHIYLPIINIYSHNEVQKSAYAFISKICDNNVPTFEESKNLEKYIWENDKKINYINIEKCVQYIENKKNLNSLTKEIDITWDWLDEFLIFIKKNHSQYLEEYAIIPNMDLDFIKSTEDLASSKNVPENMIECLESIGIKWRKIHINKNIIKFSTGTDHDIDYAVSKIYNNIRNNFDNALIVIQYIPYDEEEEYIEKRNSMYSFCSQLWKKKMKPQKDGRKFPKELWVGIDEAIIKLIIQNIDKHQKLDEKITIDFTKQFLKFLIKINYYINSKYKIFPNQNGKFCLLNDLYEDDNIPNEFKNCLKSYFNIDINDELLDKRLNELNLNIHKRRIYDYKYILKDKFSKTNYYYLSNNHKKEAAICLLKIIPKKLEKNDNNSEDKDNFQDKQRRLFYLYTIFTQENCDYIEIDRNDLNEYIWKYSNPYIYKIIIDKIEQYDDIDSLSAYLAKSKDETIKFLKYFIRYTKEGKIFVNQNNKFCYLYNVDENEILYNDGENANESLPEVLKDISETLGYDVRDILIHEKIGRPCSKSFSYDNLCKKIDSLMIKKYKDTANFNDKNFKNAANSLIEEYFDSIGEEKSKTLFPKTFANKENIILNVIYDKKVRKHMTELGKIYGSENFKKLLDNPNIINSIINGELTDSNYNSKIKELSSEESSFIVEDGEKSIKISCNKNLNTDKKTLDFYKDTFETIINYKDDLNFDSPLNQKVGYSGEAYMYEFLKNSGEYKKVTWNILTEKGFGEIFEYRGKKYNIMQDDSHYDIVVETYDNYKISLCQNRTYKTNSNGTTVQYDKCGNRVGTFK